MKKVFYYDVHGNENAISISVDERDLTFEVILKTDREIKYIVIDRDYALEIANTIIDMYMKEQNI